MHHCTKLRPKEAAEYLGLSASTLAKLRVYGGGPIFSKLGHRLVIYEVHNLDAWVAECRVASTSELKSEVSDPKKQCHRDSNG